MINSLIRSLQNQFQNFTARRPTRRRRTRSASLEQLEARHLLSAVVEPVVDYATTPATITFGEHLQLNDSVVLFSLTTTLYGSELWRTDGTAAGTFRLTDINRGPRDSFPGQLTLVGGRVFFTAQSSAGQELWTTDGTIAGTGSISFPQWNPGNQYFSDLTKFDDGNLAFISSQEVWLTDGTPGGTRKIVSLLDQSIYIWDMELDQSVPGDQHVFLRGTKNLVGTFENVLVRFDLQSQLTTVLLATDAHTSQTQLLGVHNGRLIFNHTNTEYGSELWYSDGTPESTALWLDIAAGPKNSFLSNFTQLGNSVYFTAFSDVFGNGVWFIGDNNSLPQIVKNVDSPLVGNRLGFVESDNALYIANEYGFYSLNGATATIFPYRVRCADGSCSDVFWSSNQLYDYDGYLKLYDGTDVTAVRYFSALPTFLGRTNNSVLFLADDGTSGLSIWKSDGTASRTLLVLDPEKGTKSSYPSLLTNINGDLAYFISEDSAYENNEIDRIHNGQLLQVTGTNRLRVVDTRIYSTYGFPFATVPNGLQYEKAIGTNAQIVAWNGVSIAPLTNVTSNFVPEAPLFETNGHTVVVVGEILGPGDSIQLWTLNTDGTLKERLPPLRELDPEGFVNVGGKVYFRTSEFRPEPRVWRTDGTASGTIPISSLSSEFGTNSVFYSDNLVFSDTADHHGIVFLDGLTDQVTVVKDLDNVTRYTELFGTVGLDTLLLRNGNEIWRTRGTAESTQLVMIIPGTVTAASRSTEEGPLYFILNSPVTGNGIALWKTDGTTDGTGLVAELPAYADINSVHALTDIDEKLIFALDNATTGKSEVWLSDGTLSGTRPLSTNLILDRTATFVAYDGGIAFPAATPEVGYELFRIDTTIPVAAPANIAVLSYGEGTDLTWPDVAGAIQYDVWMQNLSDPSRPVIRKRVNDPRLPLLNDTGYAIDNKLGTTAYRVWIRSLPVLGQPSPWSAAQDIVVGRNPVMYSIPSHIVQSRPTFQWTGPDDVATYEIWLTNRDTNTRVFYADGLKQTSLQSAQTLPPAKYSVWVRGTRKNGTTTNWSAITDFVVLAPATQLIGGFGVQATQRPTFTWQSVSGATGYDIQVFLAGSSTLVYRTNNVRNLQHVPTNDLPGGNYSVFIRALKGNRQFSTWSQAQSIHLLVSPANLRSTNSGFAWDAVPMATSYTYELRNAVTQSILQSATQNETTLTPTSPLSPSRYSLRVQANVAGGSSQWSSALAYEVFRPVTVSITSANTPTVDRTPTITWAPVAAAKNYEIVISQAGSSVPIYDQKDIVGFRHQVNTALLPGTYQIQVRAGFFDGSRSNLSAVQTLVIGPAPVLSFDNGKLQWNTVNGATRYELWVDYLGSPMQQKIVYLPLMVRTHYTLPTTLPKGHYQAWVRAIRFERGEQYEGLWSALQSFEIL